MSWLIFSILLAAGCSHAQLSPLLIQQKADWDKVCAEAPYGLGQGYTPSQQRAMTRLNLWHKSVDEVNGLCQSR